LVRPTFFDISSLGIDSGLGLLVLVPSHYVGSFRSLTMSGYIQNLGMLESQLWDMIQIWYFLETDNPHTHKSVDERSPSQILRFNYLRSGTQNITKYKLYWIVGKRAIEHSVLFYDNLKGILQALFYFVFSCLHSILWKQFLIRLISWHKFLISLRSCTTHFHNIKLVLFNSASTENAVHWCSGYMNLG